MLEIMEDLFSDWNLKKIDESVGIKALERYGDVFNIESLKGKEYLEQKEKHWKKIWETC